MRDSAGLWVTANLEVVVTDINDHAPVFMPIYYNGTVNGK